MPEFNPRNRNRRTREAKKSTARWFDTHVEDRREKRGPCGFHVPEGDKR